MSFPSETELIVGTAIVPILAYLAVRSRGIDVPGAIMGALICYAALLAGGISWLIVIVAFFGLSTLFTRYQYDYKRKIGSAQEKGGTRSWPNTVANGLVAGLMACAEIFTHHEVFAVAFLAAMAAAMSDTIATEVGLLSNSKPRLITNPRRLVEPGTSGGVSALGELACLGSALGVAVLGLTLGIISGTPATVAAEALAIVAAGLLAANFDSLLGGTLQGQNKCQTCGAMTEGLFHHGKRTISVKGVRLFDNHAVNLVATLTAALISIGLFLALVP